MNNLKELLLSLDVVCDNAYLDRYVELMQSTPALEGEQHHIIPRSYFKNKNITINNGDDNLILLSFGNHVLAHYYLCLCASDDKFFKDNLVAFCCMTNEHSLDDFSVQKLPYYEELRRRWRETVGEKSKSSWHNKTEHEQMRIRQKISENHANMVGDKNPNKKNLYEYDKQGKLVHTYKTIKTFSEQESLNGDGLRAQLSRDSMLLKNNKYISKNIYTKDEAYRLIADIERKHQYYNSRKREIRTFECYSCGVICQRIFNADEIKNFDNKRHFCPECDKSGKVSLGTHFSDVHKQKLGDAHRGLKWVSNGSEQRQVRGDKLTELLNLGWKLGKGS